MSFDFCDKFVGPMPVQDFLDDFLPLPETPAFRPQADFEFTEPSVSQNETKFIQAIHKSGTCPGLHFVNTTSKFDTPSGYPYKPDISVYLNPPGANSCAQPPTGLEWGRIEFYIENKPKPYDPFMRIEQLQTNPQDVSCHVGFSAGAYKTCGQLIAYASAIHRSQFRVFSFSIAIFGDTGRFLRWDRSGVIYTQPFKLADGELFQFLWRFDHLSAVDRGHDTSVSPVDDDEAELALPKLKTYPTFEKVQRSHLHKMLVWDDRDRHEKPRCYITPSVKWATDALIGRATFGYIAYDVERGNLVYLKDYWRIDHPDVQREGDVYGELDEAHVPNIAKMSRACDVPQISGRGSLQVQWPQVQRTRTQDYLSRPGGGYSWCPGHPRVEPYIHHRLVLETVGMPLNHFKSTRQLCEVIRDAIVAHTAAYNKTRILHRDVSAGNILITDKGTGILIDWDLSKKVKEDGDANPRRHSRTGTWQFISIARLLDPWSWPHEVSDDLESFFWVLLYEVVRYRNRRTTELKEIMQEVFDQHTQATRCRATKGGRGKLTCVDGRILSSARIQHFVATPCKDIIEDMRSLFHDLYLHVTSDVPQSMMQAREEQDPKVKSARKKLQTSDALLAVLDKHLQPEWDINDDGSLDLSEPHANSSGSRSRRKRKAEDSLDGSEQNIHLTRIGRMPPRSSMSRSKDSFSSQTSSHHDDIFSMSSRMHTSSGGFSSNLRSMDDGSSAKQ